MSEIKASPLTWPSGWPKTDPEKRQRSRFGKYYDKPSVHKATREVLLQLSRMDVPDYLVIVSTNLSLRNDGYPRSDRYQEAARLEPGAAVYFRTETEWRESRDETPHTVLACDAWATVGENLWAIAKQIDAMRGMERWGVVTAAQMFAGFKAIPEATGGEPWWQILGMDCAPKDGQEIVRAYRKRALTEHPDHGGTSERFARLTHARDEGLAAAGT